MPTILHIVPTGDWGGCERNCDIILGAVRHYSAAVVILGNTGPLTKRWQASGADVFVLPENCGRIGVYRELHRIVASVRPAGVIAWTSARAGCIASTVWLASRSPLVVYMGNPIRLSRRNRFAALAYSLLPGGRRAVLAPATEYIQRSLDGVRPFSAMRRQTVFNPVNVDQFPFEPRVPGPMIGRAGMLARLDSIKDHATLLKAWKLVLDRCPQATLEFAGDGMLRSRLESLTRELGINERVRFLGWRSDAAELIRSWDIVIHSTTADEGLGSSMLEAMSSGRPLVATDVGPTREVTDNGRVAILASASNPKHLAQSILSVLDQPAEVLARVHSARQWVERKFTVANMTNAYLSALDLQMTSGRPGE